MKFLYALSIVGLAQALPPRDLPPRALHKVYNLHPREHQVEERQVEERQEELHQFVPRAEPMDPGSAGILETMEAAITLLGTNVRANVANIQQTAGTISNTTAGPGTNQLLLTGENLIESAVNSMALAMQHATAAITVTRDATDSGFIGTSRAINQAEINTLATSLQELVSLLGMVRDLVGKTLAQLAPPVRQVIRPDVNVLEAAIGPFIQPIRTLVTSIINYNKNKPSVSTTLMNGVPDALEALLEAIVNNSV